MGQAPGHAIECRGHHRPLVGRQQALETQRGALVLEPVAQVAGPLDLDHLLAGRRASNVGFVPDRGRHHPMGPGDQLGLCLRGGEATQLQYLVEAHPPRVERGAQLG